MVDRPERLRSTAYGFEILGGVSLTVTGTTSRALLVGGGPSLLITNPGTVTCYITLGDVTVTATTAAGQAILPGTQVVFTLTNLDTQTYIAGINGGTSTVIQISTGYGV